MWNIKRYTAMGILGVGVACVVTPIPASAQCGCGGYGSVGYGGWGGGYGGWGGGYGGCRAHHRHGYGGYALSYMPRHHGSSYAYADYTPRHNRVTYAGSRHHHRQLYAAAHSLRYSSNHTAKRHLASLKQSTRHG
jgi:hypothetical protein